MARILLKCFFAGLGRRGFNPLLAKAVLPLYANAYRGREIFGIQRLRRCGYLLMPTGGEKYSEFGDSVAVAVSFVFFVVSADGREFDAEHRAYADFRRFDEDSSAVVFFDDAFGKRQT